MKFFLLILLIATAARAEPTDPRARFDAARAAYDEGRYADALALYDALLAEYPRMPELHFNRGNALARLGRIGEAAAAYQRVLLRAPRDADARANLKFIRERAGLPKPRSTWADRTIGILSLSEWKKIALSAWWIGAGLLIAGILFPRTPRALRHAGLAGLAIAFVASAGWAGWIARDARPVAFVVEPNVKALFAPIPTATPHFDAPEGLAVRVLGSSGEWVHVREDKREGWIPRRSLEMVRVD